MRSPFESDRPELVGSLIDKLLPHVRQVMAVEDMTTGGHDQPFAVRFRGRLMLAPEQCYDRLASVFEAAGVTLVLREQAGEHVLIGIQGTIKPEASNPWINLLMFVLTVGSVLYTGVLTGTAYNLPEVTGGQVPTVDLSRDLPLGLLYTVSLLSILLAHEFGHYLAARYHNTAVTLPYFFPFPGSPFGTLGAFIRLKQPPKNRKVLLDIGLAGPLAGMAVAVPVLLIGLLLSEVGTLPANRIAAAGQGLEGNSLLYLLVKYIATGEWLPSPVSYGGIHPVLYWLRYIFVGLPIPYGGRDVMLHPVAWAGWAGLLVTALNLIPAGQLDGGHAIYVLAGKRATRLWPFIIVALVLLGMVWTGWFLWAGLIFFLGRTYAQPLDEITPLDARRRAIAIAGLVLFVLVFTPVPLRLL